MGRFNLASIQFRILCNFNQIVQTASCRLKAKESKKLALTHEDQEPTRTTTSTLQIPLQLKPRKSTSESLV